MSGELLSYPRRRRPRSLHKNFKDQVNRLLQKMVDNLKQ